MATMSMTGFGRASGTAGAVQIEVELRSVNHRFLDTSCRLPQTYNGLETEISQRVAKQLRRGRVEIFVSRREARAGTEVRAQLNKNALSHYLKIYKEALTIAGLKNAAVSPEVVLRALDRREVMELATEEVDLKRETQGVLQTVDKALKELSAMRAREGKALERDVLKNLGAIATIVTKLDKLAAASPANYKRVLEARLKKISDSIESIPPERVAQELAVFADRVDVSEELTRMHSHIDQFKGVLRGAEGGRKLEFLLQEMGREINTCGSKSQSAEISTLIVEAKTLLEKIREQAANVE